MGSLSKLWDRGGALLPSRVPRPGPPEALISLAGEAGAGAGDGAGDGADTPGLAPASSAGSGSSAKETDGDADSGGVQRPVMTMRLVGVSLLPPRLPSARRRDAGDVSDGRE
jgi:hypothetical protein